MEVRTCYGNSNRNALEKSARVTWTRSLRQMQTNHRTQTAHLADLVLSDLPLSELAPALTHRLVEALDGTSGAIYLYNPADQLLRPIALAGDEAAEVHRPSYPPKQGIVGRTFDKGQTIVLEMSEDSSPRVGWSSACAPMKTADSVIGTVMVNWQQLVRPTDEQVQHLEQMAITIAQAVDRLQLLEQGRQRIKQLEALREIGQAVSSSLDMDVVYETFTREAAKFIQYDQIAIATVDLDQWTTTSIYFANEGQLGVPDWTKRTLRGTMLEACINAGASRYISGESSQELTERYPGLKPIASSGAKSVLSLPLYSDGKVIAGLSFFSVASDAYSPSDLEIAELLGAHLAGAIANAQLYARRKEAEEALRTAESSLGVVVNNAPIIISGIDKNGIYTLSEGKGLESRGRQPGEVVGRSVFDINRSDPEVLDSVQRAIQGENVSHEYRQAGRVFESRYEPVRNNDGEIDSIVVVGFDVTESRRTQLALRDSEEEAKGLAYESAVLAEIGRIVTTCLDVKDFYEALAQQVGKLIAFDRMLVGLVDAETSTVTSRYVVGIDVPLYRVGQAQPLTGTMTEEVVRTQKGMLFQSVNRDEMERHYPVMLPGFDSGLRSFLTVPLISDGETIAVLQICSLKPNAYNERDLELAERIGTIISGAVANASLHASVKQEAHERAVLAEIGRIIGSSLDIDQVYPLFAEKVGTLIHSDKLNINLLSDDGETFTTDYTYGVSIPDRLQGERANVAGTFTEAVVREQKAILHLPASEEETQARFPGLMSGVKSGLRSFMAAPLMASGKTIATIHWQSYQADSYSVGDLDLAERIAGQIAGAVDNAQIYADNQRTQKALALSEASATRAADENAVMAEIGRIVGSSLDMNKVYDQFAKIAGTLIPFDTLAINLIDHRSQTFTTEFSSGDQIPGLFPGNLAPITGSFTSAIQQARKSVLHVVDDEQESCARFPRLAPAIVKGIRSFMGAPLFSSGNVIGCIRWQSASRDLYTERDMELAERIANQIAGAIATAQTFAENQRTQKALALSEASATRAADENAVMAEVGQIISSSLDIQQVYEQFAAKTRDLIPFDTLVIHLVDKNSNTFTTQYTSGIRTSALQPGNITPLDGSLTEAVTRSGEAILHKVRSKGERTAQFPRLSIGIEAGFRAFLAAPLIASGEVIGTVRWQSFDVNAYDQHHKVIAERIANYVTSAVVNAQIYAENQRTQLALETSEASAIQVAHENAVMAEIGVIISSSLDINQVYEQFAQRVGTLIDFDTLTVNRVDLEAQTFITEYIAGLKIPGLYPGYHGEIPGSITEMVLNRRGPIQYMVDDPAKAMKEVPRLTPSLRAGVRSILAAPLIADSRVIGTIRWQSLEQNVYQETDLQLAERVANQMAGAMANAQIYSENQRNQMALKASEERFSGILDIADDAVVSVDESFRITMFNQGAVKIFGYEAREVIGKPLDILIPTESVSAHHGHMSGFAALAAKSRRMDERSAEVYGLRKDGTRFTAEASISKLEIGDRTVFTAILRDVTQRKRAEEALRDSEAQYRDLYEGAPIAYISTDANGTIVQANQRAVELFGYSLDQLVGGPVMALYADTPDGIEKARKILGEIGDRSSVEMEYQRADGRHVWGSLSIQRILDDDGNVVASRGMVVDITERKLLEAQLAQSQKMEAIGQLAGGVAHDFNNLLTAIIGYAQLASMDQSQTESTRKYIRAVKTAADRATGLTKQLLAFSRRQVIVPVVLNLNELVIDLDNMLRRLIGADIELVTITSADLGSVKADPGQIEQVIMNLAVNARDAMPNGGRLTIETSNATFDNEQARLNAAMPSDDYIVLAVSDTGIGMTQEVQEHMFEPFFTTKGVGEGTGLGLSTCYGIVTQSGGHIVVDSRMGEGTTFRIYLPQVDEQPTSQPRRDDDGFWPTGTETVLLVEDEPMVRSLAVEVLETQGYTVLKAANGAEALRIAESHAQEPIDLLLTDIVMPLMGGRELADHFKPLYPDAKIIYMSGYARDLPEPGAEFLQKPMTPNILVRRVRWVLDSTDADSDSS